MIGYAGYLMFGNYVSGEVGRMRYRFDAEVLISPPTRSAWISSILPATMSFRTKLPYGCL